MPLYVYNLTALPVTLVAGNGPAPSIPASTAPPAQGVPFDVTGCLRGLTGGNYTALAAQAVDTLVYKWTGEPEYDTADLFASSGGLPPLAGVLYAALLEAPVGNKVWAPITENMIYPTFSIGSATLEGGSNTSYGEDGLWDLGEEATDAYLFVSVSRDPLGASSEAGGAQSGVFEITDPNDDVIQGDVQFTPLSGPYTSLVPATLEFSILLGDRIHEIMGILSPFTLEMAFTNRVYYGKAAGESPPTFTPTATVMSDDFEAGIGGWTVTGAVLPVISTTTAHSPINSALIGSLTLHNYTARMRRTVALPAVLENRFSFWLYQRGTDDFVYDQQMVKIYDSGFSVVQETLINEISNTGVWTYFEYDLSAYAGQTIGIEFSVNADGSVPVWMYVDDVVVETGTWDSGPPFVVDEAFVKALPTSFLNQGYTTFGNNNLPPATIPTGMYFYVAAPTSYFVDTDSVPSMVKFSPNPITTLPSYLVTTLDITNEFGVTTEYRVYRTVSSPGYATNVAMRIESDPV